MVLNLAYPEQSQIPFKISKFPDGQQTIDLTGTAVHPLLYKSVQIKSRLNSFQDIELIICANQLMRILGVQHVHLYVPYFLGARSDRRFHLGGINYLKQVICPIINNQNFTSVTVIDPHSDVLEACLNNFVKETNYKLVDFALDKIHARSAQTAIVSPDAGALKKIYDVAKNSYITNVTTASKVRDLVTGNILRTELPTMDLNDIEHIIIIDDICDGGRTFIELAKEIKKQTDKPIYLIVTHGIFSAGFDSLMGVMENIFTTNSVKDIEPGIDCATIGDVPYVQQLNVF